MSLDRPEVFGELYARHFDAIYRYVAGRLGPDAADDLAAETFLAAFRRRHRFDPARGAVRPWLESVWSRLKRSVANLAKRDIAQLTALVKTRLRRMQYQPGLVEGFLAGTRLDLTPHCNLHN